MNVSDVEPLKNPAKKTKLIDSGLVRSEFFEKQIVETCAKMIQKVVQENYENINEQIRKTIEQEVGKRFRGEAKEVEKKFKEEIDGMEKSMRVKFLDNTLALEKFMKSEYQKTVNNFMDELSRI